MSDILHILGMKFQNEVDDFSAMLMEKGMLTVPLRELTAAHIRDSKVIFIDGHSDQRAICGFGGELENHLSKGGTVVFNGHLEYPVFKGLATFQLAKGRGYEDLLIERVNEHPIFKGVDCRDISVRRGVAGFYARGANPPPAGAVIVHRFIKDHSPIDWVWRRPDGGQIFMHSGNNMWMYLNDDTSAGLIVPQLIEWAMAGAAYCYE